MGNENREAPTSLFKPIKDVKDYKSQPILFCTFYNMRGDESQSELRVLAATIIDPTLQTWTTSSTVATCEPNALSIPL